MTLIRNFTDNEHTQDLIMDNVVESAIIRNGTVVPDKLLSFWNKTIFKVRPKMSDAESQTTQSLPRPIASKTSVSWFWIVVGIGILIYGTFMLRVYIIATRDPGGKAAEISTQCESRRDPNAGKFIILAVTCAS